MSVTSLKKRKKSVTKRKSVVVTKKVKDYKEDPFIVKKTNAAESFLKKHGLPKVYTK